MKNFKMSLYGAVLLAILACTDKKEEPVKNEKFCLSQDLKKTTKIQEISEVPIAEELRLSGKIEYNENDLVAFRSLVEGVVQTVHFELGDYVKKGQVLATVKSLQIQELIQQRKYFQNQINLLKKQSQSKRELLEDGLVSRPEVLETESELQSAQIELEKINENLKMFNATGSNIFQILAPKNGYIIQKEMSSGQSITSDNSPLFSVSNLNQIWAMVNIYANNLKYIKVGDEVRVTTMAYPDEYYFGKIDKIYNVFDEDDHVLKARVVLTNQNLKLLPGLSADIFIKKSNGTSKAFAIPNSAKIFSNNKSYVVVYKNDCELSIREISEISSNGSQTYVKEKFAAEEKIVESNALLIFEQLNSK